MPVQCRSDAARAEDATFSASLASLAGCGRRFRPPHLATAAGSLFALEVLHRAGVEFFEVIPFSVCAGLVCLLVFRKLTGEPYGGIWDFEAPITAVDWRHILLGAPPEGRTNV